MKIKNLLLAICIFSGTFLLAQTGTSTTETISSAGLTAGTTVNREYIIYVPSAYDGSIPYSLIFNFHGTGSNAQQEQFMCGFDKIADTAKIIMIYPEGLVQPNSQDKTAWNSLGTVQENKDTDLKFVEDMLTEIKGNYNINSCKVYATGMSIGGYMTYDVGCFLNTKFAAIASVTGIMGNDHLSACNPSHPTPVMHIHGDNDNVVPYDGFGFGTPGVQSILDYWVAYNNCTSPATMTNVPDITAADGSTAEHYLYPNGDIASTVEHYKIIGGGHTWPRLNSTTSGTNGDFNASLAIWKFFRQYCLDDLNGTPPCTPPTATISGDATICAGGSATISVALTGTGPWTITTAIDGVNQTPVSPTSSPYTFLGSTAGVYTIAALTDDGNSCAGTGSGSATLTENTTITTTNVTKTCNPGDADYIVEFDVAGGDTATYAVADGTGTFTTPTHFKSDAITSAATYTFTISDQYACGTATSVTGTKDCSSNACIASAIIDGDATICPGGSSIITISFTGTAPWNLTYAINGVDQAPVAESAPTHTFNATSAGVYTVTSISDAICTGTTSGTTTITENTPITTSGLTETCNPSNTNYVVEFDIAGGDQASYQNTGDAGTITGNHFVSSQIASGTAYTFSLNDGLACAAPTDISGTKTCSGTPPAACTATISGDGTVCNGSSTNINIELTGTGPWMVTYALDGQNQQAIPVQTSPQTVPATAVGVYTLANVTDATNCVATLSGSATITEDCGTPPASCTATISGDGTVCNGSSTNINIALTGTGPWMVTYALDGQNQQAMPVQASPQTVPATTTGVYTLANVTDATNCVATLSGSATITEDCGTPPASCTATISGNGTVCNGSSTNITIALTGTGPWMVTYALDGQNQQAMPVQTSPQIVPATAAGVYTLATVMDATNCSATVSGSATIVEDCGTPTQTCTAIATSALSEICNGSTYTVSFNITGGNPASYAVTGGTGTVSGSTFTSAAIASGTAYNFTVADGSTCTPSNSTTVSGSKTCNTGPCTATATISGGGEICNGNNVTISVALTGNPPWNFTIDPGAIAVINQNTSPYYTTVSVTGNYTIASISDDGCTGTASGSALVNSCIDPPAPGSGIVNGIEEYNSLMEVSVFPNPTSGSFVVSAENANFKELQVSIVNLLGTTIYHKNMIGITSDLFEQIDLIDVPAGLYYIRLNAANETVIKKLIIQ